MRLDLEVGNFKNEFMEDIEKDLCDIVYKFKEFWPRDYFPAYPKLARRVLPLHYKRVFDSDFTPESTIPFNRNELNICIHIRLGDWVPTSADHFIAQLKLFFKYIDTAIPINVHLFYQLADGSDQASHITRFSNFFDEFEGADLILRKDTHIKEFIDLILMSDVLMVSESSISTHLSIISQRPLVFAKPPSTHEGGMSGCVLGQHVCMQRDIGDQVMDVWVKAFAEELNTRWKTWMCVKEILAGRVAQS